MIAKNFADLKIRFLLLVLPGLLIGALPSPVNACQCSRTAPPCEEFPQASAVFIGRVIDSAEQKTETDTDGKKRTYDVGIIRFEVEEVFKGIESRIIEIHSGTTGADCGYWFTRGERYLVYAYGDQPGRLGTNVCTRTRLVEKATEDLQYLRNLPRKGIGGRIYGTVGTPTENWDENFEQRLSGISGVKVTLHSPDGSKSVIKTNQAGSFEFNSLKPGLYVVETSAPDGYVVDYPERNQFEVQDSGCGKSDFKLLPTGGISGRILDSEGNPIAKGTISLLSADTQGVELAKFQVDESWADEHGVFEIANLPPGRYLLGFNLTDSADGLALYPPTFYPNALDPAKATVIEVKLGEELSGYDITARKEVSARAIHGMVFWDEKTPASNAEIFWMKPTSPFVTGDQKVKTDKNGRFTITGGEGFKYWLYAVADKYPGRPYHERRQTYSEPVSVELKGDLSGIRLILSIDQKSFEEDFEKKRQRQ
jgi:SdrD B-like domain/Carboxypeptidase regulatory-like domain/Tissue inhibitor of metalloproteinase